MAIRKFRAKIKPFIWVMTIAFVLSMGAVTISELKRNLSSGPKHAFKVNEQKISKIEIERMKNNIQMNLGQQTNNGIDSELIETIAVNEIINGVLVEEYAKKAKIKISTSEINSEYKKIEKSIGKEQLRRMLSSKGHTKNSYKKELAKNLLIAKIGIKRNENIEQKKQIEKEIVNLKKEMIITEINEDYKMAVPRVALEREGFSMDNGDYSRRMLFVILSSGKEIEEARIEVKKTFENQVKLAKKAIEKGVVVSVENLTLDSALFEYFEGLKGKIGDEIIITSKQVESYFKKNKNIYKKPATVGFEVAKIKIETEKQMPTLKAEEIMEKLATNKIKFEQLKELEPSVTFVEKYNFIKKEDYLSNIGENQEELLKKVFKSKIGTVNLLIGNKEIIIYRKNIETKEIEPSLSEIEIKNRVENDYKNERIMVEIKKIEEMN